MKSIRPDNTLLLLLLAFFVFNSPFSDWWTSLNMPWYTIFVAWAALIILVALNQQRNNRGD